MRNTNAIPTRRSRSSMERHEVRSTSNRPFRAEVISRGTQTSISNNLRSDRRPTSEDYNEHSPAFRAGYQSALSAQDWAEVNDNPALRNAGLYVSLGEAERDEWGNVIFHEHVDAARDERARLRSWADVRRRFTEEFEVGRVAMTLTWIAAVGIISPFFGLWR
ncbi:MAG: hypothetical protein M1814_005137 [Vezdaea aestivalis]|nr:MAG: hypothetical protein M1814_005137 [Vezdaea aestivalis]